LTALQLVIAEPGVSVDRDSTALITKQAAKKSAAKNWLTLILRYVKGPYRPGAHLTVLDLRVLSGINHKVCETWLVRHLTYLRSLIAPSLPNYRLLLSKASQSKAKLINGVGRSLYAYQMRVT